MGGYLPVPLTSVCVPREGPQVLPECTVQALASELEEGQVRLSHGPAGLLDGRASVMLGVCEGRIADSDDSPLPRHPQQSVSAWSSPGLWLGPSDSS